MVIETSTNVKMLQAMEKAVDAQIARLLNEGQLDLGDLPVEQVKVKLRLSELLNKKEG